MFTKSQRQRSNRRLHGFRTVGISFLLITALPLFSSEPTNFFVEGNLLYWKADEEGLAYAMRTTAQKEHLLEPSFEWDFGFKLAMGYSLPQKNVDFLLRVTHLNTHADAFSKAREGSALCPIWITPQGPAPFSAEAIKMHWRLHLAFIDALSEIRYQIAPRLLVFPQFGLRYALVRQKFNLDYFGGDFSPDLEEFLTMKNKFLGIGPLSGLRMELPLSDQWSLCANGALSALYGQFYVHEGEYRFKGHVKRASLHETFTRVAFTLEGSLFLRWQKIWERSHRSLELLLGYDALLLWRQNHFEPLNGKGGLDNPGNLGLKGLEWGIRFNF